jgi:hypothetical protein
VVRRQTSYSSLSRKANIELIEEPDKKFSLLTDEERAELIAEVQDELNEELKKKEREEFKAQARRNLRVKKGLEEEQIALLIDLPGNADHIRIDGNRFYHGHTYTIPYSVAETLNHMMDRGWRHEEEVGGANSNEYRKKLKTTHSQRTGVTSNGPTVQQPSISPMSAGRLQPKVNTTRNMEA